MRMFWSFTILLMYYAATWLLFGCWRGPGKRPLWERLLVWERLLLLGWPLVLFGIYWRHISP